MRALKELLLGFVLLANIPTTKGGPCEEVEIVTRAEWNARNATDIEYINTAVNMSFVHHTAGTWECFDKATCILMVQDIQNLHMDTNGWSDIGYSFLIGEDGRVYEGRGWNVVGAHTYKYNSVAYGFCVIGNFMTRPPNDLALNTTQKIIDCGVQLEYTLPDYELFGHRDGSCTACPGDYLYAIIQTWAHYSFRPIPIYC